VAIIRNGWLNNGSPEWLPSDGSAPDSDAYPWITYLDDTVSPVASDMAPELAFFVYDEYGEDDVEIWQQLESKGGPVTTDLLLDNLWDDLVDEGAFYEEALVETVEWSGPIQPNAPPLTTNYFENYDGTDLNEEYEVAVVYDGYQQSNDTTFYGHADDWPWDEDVGDEDGTDPSTFLNINDTTSYGPTDDGQWWEDVGEEEPIDDGFNVQYPPIATLPPCPEDAWPHDDEVEVSFSSEGYQQIDLQPQLDDAWPHDDEVPDELGLVDDIYFNINDTTFYGAADDWPWDEDVGDEDGTDPSTFLNINDTTSYGPTDDWPWDEDIGDEDGTDPSAFLNINDTTFYGAADDWPWDEDIGDDQDLNEILGVPAAAGSLLGPEDAWPHDDEVEVSFSSEGYQQIDLQPQIEDAWPHDDEVPDETGLVDDTYLNINDTTFYGVADDWPWDENVGDDDGTDPSAFLNINDTTFYGVTDDWPWDEDVGDDQDLNEILSVPAAVVSPLGPEDAWPHDDEVEVSFSSEGYQQIDLQPQLDDAWPHDDEVPDELGLIDDTYFNINDTTFYGAADDWPWDEDVGDDQDFNEILSVPAAAGPPLGPEDAWPHDDEVEVSFSSEGYQQTNLQPQLEDAWSWDDDVGDDFDLDQILGAGIAGSVLAVYQDEWDFTSDEVEIVSSSEGYQQSDIAVSATIVVEDPFYEDPDGEDWELVILDFPNFEIDPPPADPWDFSVDDVGDAFEDLFEGASLATNVVTNSLFIFQDEWDYDSDNVDHVVISEGAQRGNVTFNLFDDAWDWEVDLGDDIDTYDDGSNVGRGNFVPGVLIVTDDPFNEDPDGEDWELIIIDFSNFEIDPPYPDGWDWDSEEGVADTWVGQLEDTSVGQDYVPTMTGVVDDPWDFGVDDIGDEAGEVLWDNDGSNVNRPDNVPAAIIIVDDPWDFSVDDVGDEAGEVLWDNDGSNVNRPNNVPAAIITVDDPWDFSVDDVGDELAERTWGEDDLVVRRANVTPLPEDPWDFGVDDVGDEAGEVLWDNDGSSIRNPSLAQVFSGDEWDWNYDFPIDFIEDGSVEQLPVPTTPICPRPTVLVVSTIRSQTPQVATLPTTLSQVAEEPTTVSKVAKQQSILSQVYTISTGSPKAV
jgi:hypothetical protein